VTAAAAEGTRPLGPLHVRATLLASRKVGAYHHLTLSAPGIAERFRPGTFVAVSVGAGDPTDGAFRTRLARRSFWIHKVKPTGGHGLTLELVVEEVGPGTRWLAGLGQGARVDVTGPLGRPFSLPKEAVSCVLVGHGHATAPMFPLAERLRERGCGVTLVVSASDEAHLLSALEARRSARAVTVVTGDGSVGLRGSPEDHLSGILERASAEVVYASGPARLLHAVAAAAEFAGAWSQVALEEPLVCATGLCHGCAVPVVGEDGAPRTARACVDGPVFRGDRVRWAGLTGVDA
jgi:dihydroorotate dehydrogenase electron transfer subunit